MKLYKSYHSRWTWIFGIFISVFLAAPVSYGADWVYTMRPGDNLWSFTDRHLKGVEYAHRLQKYNAIKDPYHIPPGTRIRVPINWTVIKPAPAVAAAIWGKVDVKKSAETQPEPLNEGVELVVGNIVSTGEDSSALIRFADGGELFLKSNSSVALDTLSAFGDTGMVDSRVRVLKGRAEIEIKPNPRGNSYYEVTTPAALTAVRGTRFRVSTDDEVVSRTEVVKGKVAVSAAGRTRIVPAPYGVLTYSGKAPTAPRMLLAAPDLSNLPTKVENVAFSFDWPAVPDASQYRVQLAPSEAFNTTLFEELPEQPKFSVSGLPDGDYFLRIRAIDKERLEGIDGNAKFTLDAHPEPPITSFPMPDETVRVRNPELVWTKTQNAANYRVQVSRDTSFTDLVVEKESVLRSAVDIGPLDDGSYFWRIGLTDTGGDTGPYSAPIPFNVKVPPTLSISGQPQFDGNKIVFGWSELEGFRYVFELARDPTFDVTLVSRTVDEPRIAMPKLLGGRYYIRMATVDDTGYRSPYGPVGQVDIPIFK